MYKEIKNVGGMDMGDRVVVQYPERFGMYVGLNG